MDTYPLIYDAVCSSTPRVMSGDWARLVEDGWRWMKNMSVAFQDTNLEYIAEVIERHGKENVAVGYPMVIGKGPQAQIALLGLYIRDVEEIISKETVDIDKFPVAWVSGAG